MIAIVLIVGLVGGAYPSLVKSNVRPLRAIRKLSDNGRPSRLRGGLVVLQFTVSIALMTMVLVTHSQLSFVRSKDPGFAKEQRVTLPLTGRRTMSPEATVERLRAIPGVRSATASTRIPSGTLNDALNAHVSKDGTLVPVGFRLPFVRVDMDFVSTYGMTVVAGRDFSRQFPADTAGAFLLNETAVRMLGWNDPSDAIGHPMRYGGTDGPVVGVLKDFHFESMHDEIKPMLLFLGSFPRIVTVRLEPDDIPGTMNRVETLWREVRPDFEFTYTFLDDRFAALYEADQRLGDLISLFTVLALFVACLGLLGLAAHAVERRVKEFGVRRVLGASGANIVGLLMREFTRFVLLACAIGAPLAWYASEAWLGQFAYRIDAAWWMFAASSCCAIAIALMTISAQAIKAARRDPVEALRYE
jgi:putative ABC transport system permease protein